MNKFHIILAFVLIIVFISIIIITQNGSSTKNLTTIPTLPPEASTFKLASNAAERSNQAQVQQNQQQAMPTFSVEEGVKASYSATIKTTKGNIEVMISGKDAPRQVKNFIDKAKNDHYKNLKFHRVEDWVVQGGDPNGNGTGGQLVQTEINALPFKAGSLGVAGIANPQNGQIVSNDSQFFITKTDASWLDQKYTNFGEVTSGMSVVNSLQVGDKILGITIND